MSVSKNEENTKYIILNILSFILLGSPVLFLENEALTGICTVIGFMLFISSARCATNGKQVFYTILILWVAQTLRFSMIFGNNLFFIIVVAVLLFGCTIGIGIGMYFDNLFRRKYLPYIAVFFVPVFYTIETYILTSVNLGYVSNVTGYIMCIPSMSHNMKWLGEFGMTFIVMLILSITAHAFTGNNIKSIILPAVIGIMMFGALYVYGDLQQMKATEPSYTINVAVGISEQMDFIGNSFNNYTDDDRLEIFRSEIKQAVEMDADLFVLNEEFFELSRNNEEYIMENVCSIVKQNNIPVIFCVDLIQKGNEPGENKAMYIDENGNILFTYYKHNLVPFIENNYLSNTTDSAEYATITINGHEINLACVICFDLNDDLYIRKIRDDTELLIAPSWDWDRANLEQKRTFVKSVELNTTLLKHTYEGFTYASGPYGVYGEMLDNRGMYEQIRMIEVPIWEK